MIPSVSNKRQTTVAVIIPALNEALNLPKTLSSLRLQVDPPDRILIVDGGSTDGTVAIAEQAGAMVLVIRGAGRGGQIAIALPHVTEQVVVIGHADMLFPPEGFSRLRRELELTPNAPGGCFGHRYDRRRFTLWLVEAWDYARARWQGISYGDQGQFFRTDRLNAMGGFPDQPIMEDVELSRRLLKSGTPIYLNVPIVVSARRFERLGFWRTVLTNLRLRWVYRREGLASCRRLYERYYAR